MTEAQKKIASAIEKFAEAELTRAEADKIRAKADEYSSFLNQNLMKIILEDRAVIKQLMEEQPKFNHSMCQNLLNR